MEKINVHRKYQPLFTSDSRYFVMTGGRGSGKSFGASLFLLNLTYEPGHKILFTRYTLTSANVSIIPEFLEKIELMDKGGDFRITKDEIINLTTGSSIMFRGIRTSSGNQTAALKSITGLTTFVLDEAEELLDEEIFEKIDFSARKQGMANRVIIIMNPTTKEHWVWERFFEKNFVEGGYNGTKGNTTYIHTTYKDNIENLPESFLQSIFEMKLKRPDKYEHQILGGWLEKADGVVFNNWRLGDFIPSTRTCYGQDFGFADDPTTLVKVSLDLEGGKMYVKEVYSGSGLSTGDIARKNTDLAGTGLIIADRSEPRLISELKMRGCNIRRCKKETILAGISIMQDLEIIVDPNSQGIIKELNNYVWHINNERPIDKYNHFIDAIRYAVLQLYVGKRSGEYIIR